MDNSSLIASLNAGVKVSKREARFLSSASRFASLLFAGDPVLKPADHEDILRVLVYIQHVLLDAREMFYDL